MTWVTARVRSGGGKSVDVMHLLVKVENVSRFDCIGNGGGNQAEEQSEMHDKRDSGSTDCQPDKRWRGLTD
ncbi:MFS transporter [Fusarium oxysporum f. sp. albedinis]|nr:MFS transporter [Fusarium oxysporum f. sp. albedinis]